MLVPRFPLIVLVLACSAALGACGESTLHRISTSTTSTTAPTTTGSAAGLGARSPRSLLVDGAAALARVRTYHVEATQSDDDGTSHISADVAADGRFHGVMRTGAQLIDVIAIGSATYLKANRAYWAQLGGPRARHLGLLAGRWVKAPGAATAGLRETLDKLQPDHLALCLRKSAAAKGIVNDGERRWHGQRVVVLRDPGRRPGSSPSALYLAASGEPLTLRQTQSGRRVPGGRIDRECDDPDSTIHRADSVFSDYDAPVRIEVPPNALDLDRLTSRNDLTPA